MTEPGADYVKLHFRLETQDDWPPAGVESLWAVDQGDGTVRLDNVPWFVRGVACGDVVAASVDEDGVLWAGDVVRPSENCTVRLIVLRDNGSGAKVQGLLDHGVAKGWWDMEEGCVTPRWRAVAAGSAS